jgi:hypothetical protein
MSDTKPPSNRGRWKPGQSGNPSGRPAGIRAQALETLDRLGRAAAEELVLVLINQAKSGDTRAAESILKRVWPQPTGRAVSIDLPVITTAQDALKATAMVIAAVTGGQIDPNEGQTLTALIETARRALEAVDLERRIAALEARGA